MSITTTVKKVVADQAYATVGATDLAVETVRSARAELAPAKVQERVKAAPAEVEKRYTELTDRGEKLVERIRTQAATKDLLSQAEATLALGKGVVTTVRKAAGDVERSTKATLTTGRKEAAKAAGAVVDSVHVDVDTDKASTAVGESAKRTRTAAKRTTTTAKKAARSTTTATKSASTSARKTAAKSTKATKKAAEKVGG